MKSEKKIGLVGLGAMGKNLAMNIPDWGYSVTAYDKKAAARNSSRDETKDSRVAGTRGKTTRGFFRRMGRSSGLSIVDGPHSNSQGRER